MARRIARRLGHSLVASEDKNPCLRVDVQQRVILVALRVVDADSAVDEICERVGGGHDHRLR